MSILSTQEIDLKSPCKHHAFTVDVEDWYHGAADLEVRTSSERRLCYGLGTLLDLLAEFQVKATFFWLGVAASENPHLVEQVAEAGHEIACHGWVHEPIYDMSPKRFREETQQAANVISDLAGQPVTAYRAPYFSITRKSLWALEILAELGFQYDSSIFPIHNWRYGIANFDPMPQQIITSAGSIYEIPLSVRRFLGSNMPVSGGAYFRLYPYAITRCNFLAAERRNQPVVFYIHPWELDLNHPDVPLTWKEKLTHSINARTTEQKLRRVLSEHSFVLCVKF
ncbi:polysaccharide deacetylase family protein [Phormidium tenue FACHB-886]|nr:polysaccharide deacetylase family protein [Phormidium tenue FACHB-886]